jgi:hypothetical protein
MQPELFRQTDRLFSGGFDDVNPDGSLGNLTRRRSLPFSRPSKRAWTPKKPTRQLAPKSAQSPKIPNAKQTFFLRGSSHLQRLD